MLTRSNIKRTEIVRVLKSCGNRSRTKNLRKCFAYLKRTKIVRALKKYEIRTSTKNERES